MYPVNHKSQDVIMTVIKKPAAVNIVLAPQMLQKKHYPVVSKSVIARFSFNDVCTCISDVSGAVDNLGLTNLASITPPGTVFWIRSVPWTNVFLLMSIINTQVVEVSEGVTHS